MRVRLRSVMSEENAKKLKNKNISTVESLIKQMEDKPLFKLCDISFNKEIKWLKKLRGLYNTSTLKITKLLFKRGFGDRKTSSMIYGDAFMCGFASNINCLPSSYNNGFNSINGYWRNNKDIILFTDETYVIIDRKRLEKFLDLIEKNISDLSYFIKSYDFPIIAQEFVNNYKFVIAPKMDKPFNKDLHNKALKHGNRVSKEILGLRDN